MNGSDYSVRSFADRKGKFMKSKVEFYKAFFEELEKKGFGVAQPSSPDYVVDIQFKGKTIAFYTKADMIEKNPFVEVSEKQMERLWSMAKATASLCGICADQPYEEEKAEKLKNGVMKLNEHNGVILACKKHPLFDYVLSTYKQDAQNDNRPIQRQYFYNREEAFESFATRSGLVDERKLFTETQLQLIHAGLVKLRTMDEELSEEDMKTGWRRLCRNCTGRNGSLTFQDFWMPFPWVTAWNARKEEADAATGRQHLGQHQSLY